MKIDKNNYQEILYPLFNNEKDLILFYIPRTEKFALIHQNLIKYKSLQDIIDLNLDFEYAKTIEDMNNIGALIDFLIAKIQFYYDKHYDLFNELIRLKKNLKKAQTILAKELL